MHLKTFARAIGGKPPCKRDRHCGLREIALLCFNYIYHFYGSYILKSQHIK